jgi:hypothetical protein
MSQLAESQTAAPRYPWRVLTGSALKWIAIACMVVDHIAAVFVYGYYKSTLADPAVVSQQVYQVYYWMRVVGRITFPIFCFELVEGSQHTRSFPRYALRLLAFALVSEVPYDLALHSTDADWTVHLNIMVTLLAALLPMWAGEACGRRAHLPWWVGKIVAAVAMAGLWWVCSNWIHPSYEGYGILLAGALYLGKESRIAQFALAAIVTYYHGNALQNWCLVGVALACLFYNGKKGHMNKWVSYTFYPGHLLVIAIAAGTFTWPAFARLFLG